MTDTIFYIDAFGATPEEAFARAKASEDPQQPRIAQKAAFVVVDCAWNQSPYQVADELIDTGDPRFTDRTGPAGCIQMNQPREGDIRFLFFGWAQLTDAPVGAA